MGNHIRSHAQGLFDQFRNNRILDMFGNKPKLTYLRLEFKQMFNALIEVGDTYKTIANYRGNSAL
ncbi:MAG: hypothetical protein H6765_06170 [Candidatus Peribacteria bacterium]|nr:MAG: hypothetical protein H6765_06170 [Candidatus Peribacteria bacterium]